MMQTIVAVLRGGISDEHDISLKTGASVLTHLAEDEALQEKYRARDVFIDRNGTWHARGVPMTPERALRGVDTVFNALHGGAGEDGTVQRMLGRIGIPYTGSPPFPSSIAMNKTAAKLHLEQVGIKTPQFKIMRVSPTLDQDIVQMFRSFPQPSVVKPVNSGSSVGVTFAKNFNDFNRGVRNAFNNASQVLVEEYVPGKEATCGVIDRFRNKQCYELLPVEIILPAGKSFFNYDAKYSGETKEVCPGSFSQSEVAELQRLARLAHTTLGLRHYSRSDFIVSSKGIYFLESNTLPGLTQESLLPKSFMAVGISTPEFIDHVLTLAREKS